MMWSQDTSDLAVPVMIGPPGAGKSMLAQCLAGLMPLLAPAEALSYQRIVPGRK